jgi:hypothetical protein
MPVEIRKLVIQAKVADKQAPTSSIDAPRLSDEQYQQLVEACVKEVLKILKREKAR